MNREDRKEITQVLKLIRPYLEQQPERYLYIYRTWARGLAAADDAIKEIIATLKDQTE